MTESLYNLLATSFRYVFILILAVLFFRMVSLAVQEHRWARRPGDSAYCGVLETVRGGESIHYGITRDNVIGRSRRCDITLLPRSVAPVGAHLYWGRDGWILYSMNGRRPLRVNGQTISRKTCVHDGDLIQLGNVTLRLRLWDEEEE